MSDKETVTDVLQPCLYVCSLYVTHTSTSATVRPALCKKVRNCLALMAVSTSATLCMGASFLLCTPLLFFMALASAVISSS